MMDYPWEMKVQHILREGNRGADAMVNLGINLPIGYHEFDIAPKGVKDIVMQDIISVFMPRMCL